MTDRPTPADPPAGWHEDPDEPGTWRWWDGERWTEHRSRAGPPGSSPPRPADRAAGRAAGELAAPGPRLGAVLLDSLIGTLAVWVALVVPAFVGSALVSLDNAGAVAVGIVLILGGIAGAFWLLAVYHYVAVGRVGQTYGKHLLDLRVVSERAGQPIGSWRAVGRELVKALGIYALGLGVLWILWDDRRQGWHDKAVGSVVVRAPTEPHLNPVAFLRHVLRTRR